MQFESIKRDQNTKDLILREYILQRLVKIEIIKSNMDSSDKLFNRIFGMRQLLLESGIAEEVELNKIDLMSNKELDEYKDVIDMRLKKIELAQASHSHNEKVR